MTYVALQNDAITTTRRLEETILNFVFPYGTQKCTPSIRRHFPLGIRWFMAQHGYLCFYLEKRFINTFHKFYYNKI